MRWSMDAEEAIAKVPFFVRRKVRKKIEMEAQAAGSTEVTLQLVQAVKQNYLRKMEDDVKGYRVETCFGPSGCPNRISNERGFSEKVEEILRNRNLKSFLKSKVQGPLKFHHEFSVSISDCPNACSRPQICDIGIIAAAEPVLGPHECTLCELCADACLEHAVAVTPHTHWPVIDATKCVSCGQCVKACPNETLVTGREGFRIMIGGKLGRRPRLASELNGIFSAAELFELIERILDFYVTHSQRGERLGEIVERVGIEHIESLHEASTT